MSGVGRLNDAPVLDQIDGQYEKFLLMILRKYKPNGVVITLADLQNSIQDNQGDPFVLFVHGHKDSIEFKAIRMSAAQKIADHDKATNQGRA